MAAWEPSSKEYDDDGVDESPLMAIGDSNMEEKEVKFEVSILDLKDKLHLCSKKR